ncbi:MAG: RagB/SusD family nutrient uptake outer membrane protein [Prevotella sp.]|nr:RagB/SusD family nutrient uptake outer membrane protein [Prevotella sp.]
MKLNRKNIAIVGILLAGLTSCSDFLETKSPSRADAEFVFSNSTTAQAALDGAYTFWRTATLNNVFCNNEFYGLDAAGSDIEKAPEKYTSQLRHVPLTFYEGGAAASTFEVTSWNAEGKDAFTRLYAVVGAANNIIFAIQEAEETYNAIQATSTPTAMSQIYGEAICLRASAYRELLRYYGDIPYQTKAGEGAVGFTSRCTIYDKCIADLEFAAPRMNPVKAASKNKFSSTYAYALLGRMCLEAAGYQLYRNDVAPVDGNGNAVTLLTDQPWSYTQIAGATYGRRSDHQALYQKARDAFQNCLSNLGDAKFDDSNFATFFNQMHGDDNSFADESIFEDPLTQGGSLNCERPYAFGRPAAGTKKDGFPCGAYGQTRINPAFYYGIFNPKDKRRDLAVAITGSDTKGVEALLSFNPGNRIAGGGLACNKFDENRQKNPYMAAQRKSGINIPYMRISEVYLGLAEALAALGKNGDAATYYNKTRVRSGLPTASSVTVEEVIDERGFEYAAEGDRRWALIRTGLIGKKIYEMKELTRKMIAGLETDGYYRFDNGNEISSSVYVKAVAPGTLGYTTRLVAATTSTLEGGHEPADDKEAMQYPGWRGQHDWHIDGKSNNVKVSYFEKTINDGASNLCIKGLFKHLDSAPAGYTEKAWGSDIVANKVEYYDNVFKGWDCHTAPIYLVPFNETECTSSGITNGYGFKVY